MNAPAAICICLGIVTFGYLACQAFEKGYNTKFTAQCGEAKIDLCFSSYAIQQGNETSLQPLWS